MWISYRTQVRRCHQCGEVGHFEKECPKIQDGFPTLGRASGIGGGGINPFLSGKLPQAPPPRYQRRNVSDPKGSSVTQENGLTDKNGTGHGNQGNGPLLAPDEVTQSQGFAENGKKDLPCTTGDNKEVMDISVKRVEDGVIAAPSVAGDGVLNTSADGEEPNGKKRLHQDDSESDDGKRSKMLATEEGVNAKSCDISIDIEESDGDDVESGKEPVAEEMEKVDDDGSDQEEIVSDIDTEDEEKIDQNNKDWWEANGGLMGADQVLNEQYFNVANEEEVGSPRTSSDLPTG